MEFRFFFWFCFIFSFCSRKKVKRKRVFREYGWMCFGMCFEFRDRSLRLVLLLVGEECFRR